MTLFEIFKKTILSPTEVIQKAIQEKVVPPNDSPEYIKENFSQLVEELQINAYNIYLESEKIVGKSAIKKLLLERTTENAGKNDVIMAVGDMFNDLDRFFLSLTQSRRVRAGSAFEIVLKTLFKSLDYPFDEQQVINGKPDFLMPSRQHYNRNSMDCIIFTAKRTLRERWRQIVTEGTRGLGFYLATIDEGISAPQLGEMLNHRIYIVVPENIKTKLSSYMVAPNVITYEDFFRQHLDPAVRRWKENGIIS